EVFFLSLVLRPLSFAVRSSRKGLLQRVNAARQVLQSTVPMPSKKPMTPPHLQWANPIKLPDSTMLLALTGWMDGGSVSTGTVRQLMNDRDLVEVAHLESDPFYIYNFPGSMEVAALFRPNVKYA